METCASSRVYPSSRAVFRARARSSASPASGGVFEHCRRITSAPAWITTCQCFLSGFHSTLAELVCVIVMLQPQVTWETRQMEGGGAGGGAAAYPLGPLAEPPRLGQPGAHQKRR